MSHKIGFGTYRVTDQSPEHIAALQLAIESGVYLIDTSTNYMDGHAELAVGKALEGIERAASERVTIVSKFGYLQGSVLAAFHKNESFEEVVRYSPECYHCIHPVFMRDQLQRSLQRLGRETIDCYLLHNPEYYLLDALAKNLERDEALKEMYRRIYEVFVALEEEVSIGRIGSYGISSNAFANRSDNPEFLPYTELVDLAQRAALAAGKAEHGFTTVQLPINMLESDGLACAQWAKRNGLRVLVNRPLNAQKEALMYRLADYEESREYYLYLNATLDMCDNETLRSLYNLVEQLDQNRHRFGWVGEYEQFLYTQILPHVRKAIAVLDDDERFAVAESLNLFFEHYRRSVAYECSKAARVQLKEELAGCKDSLQACALNYLRKNDDIDYVLTGMRKPSYVTDIMGIPL